MLMGAPPALRHPPQEKASGLEITIPQASIAPLQTAANILLLSSKTRTNGHAPRIGFARPLRSNLLPLPFYPINQGISVTKVGI